MARTRSQRARDGAVTVAGKWPNTSATRRLAITSSALPAATRQRWIRSFPFRRFPLADVQRNGCGSSAKLPGEVRVSYLEEDQGLLQQPDELEGDFEGLEGHGRLRFGWASPPLGAGSVTARRGTRPQRTAGWRGACASTETNGMEWNRIE